MTNSLNTDELYMKQRGSHAGNVITRQFQRVISLKTSNLYMRNPTQPYHSIDLGRKYHCNLYSYYPTQNCHLKAHLVEIIKVFFFSFSTYSSCCFSSFLSSLCHCWYEQSTYAAFGRCRQNKWRF